MTAERLNRAEAVLVARTPWLPATPSPRWLVAVSLAARGGTLWWVLSALLALRPGASRRAATRGVIALGTAMLTGHLAGRVARRRRPRAWKLPARRALPEMPSSPSFPSVHAAGAAAFATATAIQSPAIGALTAPLAVVVAYSRVRTRVHWPSDVVGGAVWGTWVGVLASLPRR